MHAIFVLIGATALFIGCDTYKPNITMVEAVEAGNEKVVDYYLKHGEMVNQKDEEGRPLITLATRDKRVSIVKKLIKAGAKVNAETKDGRTALFFADNGKMAKLLIDAGAYVDHKSDDGWTPLMSAIIFGRTDVVKILIQNKADINERDNCGSTMLMHACTTIMNKEESGNIIRLLASAGYRNVDAMGVEWLNCEEKRAIIQTALMIASGRDNTEAIELLIKMGADVNKKNNFGSTALISASAAGATEAVKILIRNGADVNARDLLGSALDRAKGSSREIVNILKQAGARE